MRLRGSILAFFPYFLLWSLTAIDRARDHVLRPPEPPRLGIPGLEVARLRVLGAALRRPRPRVASGTVTAKGLIWGTFTL